MNQIERSRHRLTTLIYMLIRDKLPSADVVSIIQDIDVRDSINRTAYLLPQYTSKHLVAHAKELVDRLIGKEPERFERIPKEPTEDSEVIHRERVIPVKYSTDEQAPGHLPGMRVTILEVVGESNCSMKIDPRMGDPAMMTVLTKEEFEETMGGPLWLEIRKQRSDDG